MERSHDPGPRSEADLLDAMIEERLAAKGKRLIDDEQLGGIGKAISDLYSRLRP